MAGSVLLYVLTQTFASTNIESVREVPGQTGKEVRAMILQITALILAVPGAVLAVIEIVNHYRK
jgi:hypothetical protein